MTTHGHRRTGIAVIALVVGLSVLALVMTAIAWQIVGQRNFLARRELRVQSYWLTQAGIERAVASLIQDQSYKGETLELMPGERMQIKVERRQDQFHVTSTGRYPKDDPNPVVTTATRTFRLVKDGDKIRLEAMSSAK